MPPKPKKNVCVVILDLQMERAKAKRILRQIIITKNILNKNDEATLVLLNCAETSRKAFPNVNVAFPNEKFSLEMLDVLDGETAEANWLDAVKLSIEILQQYIDEKNVFNRQVIFVTDLKHPMVKNSEEKLQKTIKHLKETEILFYVVGADVTWSREIEETDDLLQAMEELEAVDVNNESFQIMKAFIIDAEGVICDENEMLSVLRFFSKNIPKQPWLQPLTLENFTFPTITAKFMDCSIYPRAKSSSLYKPHKNFVLEPEEGETNPIIVPADSVTKAYSFLDKIITLPNDVKESFKYKGNKMFKLLGFIRRDKFPEVYFKGGEAHRVTADLTKLRHKLFLELVQAAEAAGKIGLALRAYYNNTKPRLYLLIPDHNAFLMVPHPRIVKETSRLNPPVANPLEADPEKLSAFSSYLNSISRKQFRFTPDSDVGVSYKQLVKNIADVVLGEDSVDNGEDLEEKTAQLVEAERVCGIAAVKVNEEKKMELDDDEDW